MKNKRYILLIITLVIAIAVGFRLVNRQVGQKAAAERKAVIRKIASKKISQQEKSIVEENFGSKVTKAHIKEPPAAEQACLDRLGADFKEKCPDSSCVLKNLKEQNSWAYKWAKEAGIGHSSRDRRGHISQRQSTKFGKIQYALARAGMLDGREIAVDQKDAMKRFAELVRIDSDNSLPFLYIARLLFAQGDTGAAEEWLAKAVEPGKQFRSYNTDFYREVLSHNLNSRENILASYALAAALPVAKYAEIRMLTQAFPEYALSVAQQLSSEGDSMAYPQSEMDLTMSEYIYGQLIYQDVLGYKPGHDFKEVLRGLIELRAIEYDKATDRCDQGLYNIAKYFRQR